MVQFTTTPAEIQDIDEILEITRLCRLSPWSPEDLKDEIGRTNSLLIVVFSGDRENVQGFISGRLVPAAVAENLFDAEIYNIGVKPESRNKGAGALLLSEFLDQCRGSGVSDVWLEVRVSNEAALRFYRAHGFTDAGVRKAFYSGPVEDALALKLTIGKFT